MVAQLPRPKDKVEVFYFTQIHHLNWVEGRFEREIGSAQHRDGL